MGEGGKSVAKPSCLPLPFPASFFVCEGVKAKSHQNAATKTLTVSEVSLASLSDVLLPKSTPGVYSFSVAFQSEVNLPFSQGLNTSPVLFGTQGELARTICHFSGHRPHQGGHLLPRQLAKQWHPPKETREQAQAEVSILLSSHPGFPPTELQGPQTV